MQGKDYSYDPYTGAFKLFGGTVGAVPIRIYAVRSNIINLSSGTVVELEETKYLYDGTAKTPKITNIYHKDQYGTIKYLEEGVDYEISYKNNVNPGTGSVVIKGLEWFSGTYYANFEIYQKDISATGDTFGRMEVEEGTYTYTGQEHKPKVTKVTYNTRYTDENGDTAVDTVELTEGVDYTVSYENNINAGYETASVIVTGMGQYTGTITKTFSIEKARLTDCTITGTKVPYTGEKQTYDITLTYNGMVLEESYNSGGTMVHKDYGVSILSGNSNGLLNAGDKQKLNIVSTGDNYVGTMTVEWEIVPYDISNETVYVVENYGEEIVFTGKEQDLSDRWAIYLTIWIDGVLQSVHGTLTTPVTNVDDSSTFVATSGQNYSGSLDVTGFMEPADISKAAVSMKDLTYNGEEQSMSITSDLADYDLKEGRDYTISGTTKATEPGTYTITMTGKGNFSGTRKESWEIKPVDISQVTLEMEKPALITYDGEPHTLDTVVKYTYPNGNTVEIPGTWSACTDIDDVAVFTADSDYFTGTYELGVIIEPLDITNLVVFPESGAYNGHKHVPIAAVEGFTDFTDYTYELTYDKEPIDVGTYTAYIKGKGNFTGTAERTYKVTPAELSVKVTLENKTYDGTKDVEIKNATLQDVLTGDDVTLDYSNLQIILSSADAGTYPTATATGLTLSGSDVTNYTYNLETVTLRDTYNDVFYIRKAEVHIVAEEQDINETEELDQTKWHVHETFPVPEGFTLTGITLAVDEEDNSVIVPSGGKITKNDTNEDVTENFEFTYYNSNLSVVCINHDTSDNGFCPNCDVYEPATRNDNGTPDDEYDDYYEIANGGQLYWYAEQVNKYGLSNTGAVLVKDIVVNRDMTAGNLREWTPINNLYATFDGQGHTVSGLYCKTAAMYAGFFGYTGYYPVKNLIINNSHFESSNSGGSVGAIAGYSQAEISNCGVTNTVTVVGNNSYTVVGSFVGDNASRITNSYAMASTFVGSNFENYGATIENCYYLADEDSDGYNGTTAKSADAFASGEVAYLLQSGVKGEVLGYDENDNPIYGEAPQVWGQNIDNGSTTQSYPVLSDATVYKVNVYDCPSDTVAVEGYSNTAGDIRTTTHTDSNADEKCDICGEFVDGIGARLAGYTLSLDGNIGVNFYMELDAEVANDTSAYMLFTLPGGGTQTVLVSQATKNTTLTAGKTYYVFSCKVAAKEMTDTIKAQMICSDGSDGTKAGTEYTYSVREYALALIGRAGATEKEIALAKAMLNYGAYAQTYFNYKTDTLANVGYEDNALTISAESKKALKNYVPEVNVTEGSDLTYAGSTIRLESELKVRHYFKLAEGATEPSGLTLYVPPAEYAEEITDTYYYYESAGIAFGSWGTKTAYSEVAGNTITYCPLSYVTTVVATKADSDLSGETSLQNLMKALYLYYQAVVSYNAN